MKLLYWPEWQKLRVSCTADRHPYNGLLTADGANDVLDKLNTYISKAEVNKEPAKLMGYLPEHEEAVRAYRVNNYLTAAVNGLTSQRNRLPHLLKVDSFLDNVTNSFVDMSATYQAEVSWKWGVVYEELEKFFLEDRQAFKDIFDDMMQRVIEKGKTAEEMMQFIGLMREVNDKY